MAVAKKTGSPRLSGTRNTVPCVIPSSTVCKVKQTTFFNTHFITTDQCHHTLKFAFHGFNAMGTKMVSVKYRKSRIKGMKECRRGSSLIDV